MRSLVIIVVCLLTLAFGWFMVWRGFVASQVKQVRNTVTYHAAHIKEATPTVTFENDGVNASGFPFAFRVAIDHPVLIQQWGTETFTVSFDYIELERVNSHEARYRVTAPASFDALYAQTGQAPEQYRVTLNEAPEVLLRATGDSLKCPAFTGVATICPDAVAGTPLISFAVQLPSKLMLTVEHAGQTKQIGFDSVPVPVPVFFAVPPDVSRPLQTFVGMLREATVFQK